MSGEIVVTPMLSGDWRVSTRSGRRPEEFKACAEFALGYLSMLTLRAQEVYPEVLSRVSFKKLLNDQEWMNNDLSSHT